MSFPYNRNRRLRKNQSIRDLVQENRLHPSDFIVPLFFMDGQNNKEEISSMPGYFRYTLDLLVQEAKECYNLGIRSALLFAKVEENLKNNKGKEAINPNGLMQRAIKKLKKEVPELYLMSDVAMDPYSSYGHDGIVENEEILNDPTLDILTQMAVSHAEAGVDMVAPSDMMDGRVGCIREGLEEEDVELTEFSDEIEAWIIQEFKNIGLDTAKSVLDASVEELLKRTDLEEESILDVQRILKEEFED